MSINKYSSPEEVKEFFHGIEPQSALRAHLDSYYPEWMNICGPTQEQMEKAIRVLSTKAMETL